MNVRNILWRGTTNSSEAAAEKTAQGQEALKDTPNRADVRNHICTSLADELLVLWSWTSKIGLLPVLFLPFHSSTCRQNLWSQSQYLPANVAFALHQSIELELTFGSTYVERDFWSTIVGAKTYSIISGVFVWNKTSFTTSRAHLQLKISPRGNFKRIQAWC